MSNDDLQKLGASRSGGVTPSLGGDRLRRMLGEQLAQASKAPRGEVLEAVPELGPTNSEEGLEAVPELGLAASGEQGGGLELPQAEAPSLEDLHVTVPESPPITEDDLIMRFHELVRERGARRTRALGEPIALGDQVRIDTLGYAGGELIPFSVRNDLEMELAPQVMLPGLMEALEGTPVGESVQVEISLPDDYPVESLRGATARFLVDVHAAEELQLPDPESEEFLQRLGRGETLDAVMESLMDELADERADELWLEAQELVIDEIVRRTEMEVSPELVNEEIYRRWNEAEAPLLRAKNFSPDELQDALEGWLKDPSTRVQAERDLRASVAFRAIIERDGLELTPERLDEVLELAIEPFGLSLAEAHEALQDPEAAPLIMASARQVMAFEHVMEQARIQFEGVEEPASGDPAPEI
ncbi:FKBP-type peptidyl-prolyl cis-trans isomerase [Hyalangium versicolor]|uniref:FKBP-type peptidyl-prolyl cis-trans isomerase n=1 Tax=Hyalangium versicolor TaxID=2861190 RepID=UPI001CC9B6B6|nr:FKBP-type peptidyl-prolyl cis-trans isomerase [Hyalangium versicolor]